MKYLAVEVAEHVDLDYVVHAISLDAGVMDVKQVVLDQIDFKDVEVLR